MCRDLVHHLFKRETGQLSHMCSGQAQVPSHMKWKHGVTIYNREEGSDGSQLKYNSRWCLSYITFMDKDVIIQKHSLFQNSVEVNKMFS